MFLVMQKKTILLLLVSDSSHFPTVKNKVAFPTVDINYTLLLSYLFSLRILVMFLSSSDTAENPIYSENTGIREPAFIASS